MARPTKNDSPLDTRIIFRGELANMVRTSASASLRNIAQEIEYQVRWAYREQQKAKAAEDAPY